MITDSSLTRYLIKALSGSRLHGGIEAVARIARDFAKDLDLDGLTLALDALGQVAAAQRLGFVLDRLGQIRAAKSVAAWLDGRRRAVQLLEMCPVDRMKHALMQDPRWAVDLRERACTVAHAGAVEQRPDGRAGLPDQPSRGRDF
ncbi:hypothetical protein [Cupriavidus basilensis]|uniref:hypothetical protein n=1 Tax=Cupriavidus basilensis TaxID=68895 RepID=UPI0023E80C4D|nr:hypothetical protein [Cupriavidus basilensis]MDF3881133.1 hypothetical protein [Cupriavidus basilensis]